MASYRQSSGGGRSYTRAPRVSLGRGTSTSGQRPLASAGVSGQSGMAPASRVGGSMGYRKGQDVATGSGGTKF